MAVSAATVAQRHDSWQITAKPETAPLSANEAPFRPGACLSELAPRRQAKAVIPPAEPGRKRGLAPVILRFYSRWPRVVVRRLLIAIFAGIALAVPSVLPPLVNGQRVFGRGASCRRTRGKT